MMVIPSIFIVIKVLYATILYIMLLSALVNQDSFRLFTSVIFNADCKYTASEKKHIVDTISLLSLIY